MNTSIPSDLVDVAYIAGAYGIKGMVKVKPYVKDSVLLHTHDWWLQRVDLQGKPLHEAYAVKLVRSKEHADYVVALFADCHDRNQAELLKGLRVLVPRASFPRTQKDEFYWVDLQGCKVYTEYLGEEYLLGVVEQVSDNGAHAVLHIDRYRSGDDGQLQIERDDKGNAVQSLVPFVNAHVLSVDIAKHRIVVDWPVDF